jgi:hypothetical protein
MPRVGVIIKKHIKTYLLNTWVITEKAKLRKMLRKMQASTSTDPTPNAITYKYNQVN